MQELDKTIVALKDQLKSYGSNPFTNRKIKIALVNQINALVEEANSAENTVNQLNLIVNPPPPSQALPRGNENR